MATKKRLIDADEAVRISKEERFMWAYDLTDLEEFLADVPTVDAVEVVRCKDCKSWKCLREDRGLCKHPTFTLEDDTIDPVTEPDDFCSYGERRTDGNTAL